MRYTLSLALFSLTTIGNAFPGQLFEPVNNTIEQGNDALASEGTGAEEMRCVLRERENICADTAALVHHRIIHMRRKSRPRNINNRPKLFGQNNGLLLLGPSPRLPALTAIPSSRARFRYATHSVLLTALLQRQLSK